MKRIPALWIAWMAAFIGLSGADAGPDVDISAGLSPLTGNTTYQIGGRVEQDGAVDETHFPISELKWPMNVILLSLQGRAAWPSGCDIEARGAVNLTPDAGVMEHPLGTDLSLNNQPF